MITIIFMFLSFYHMLHYSIDMLLDMGDMFSLRNLSVRFDTTIFEDASFVALANSLLTITGKSGSGKTTLLKCIMQQIKGIAGILQYNDIVIDKCLSLKK